MRISLSRSLIFVILVLSLAACGPVYARKDVAVSMETSVHEISYDAALAEPSPEEESALAAFIGQFSHPNEAGLQLYTPNYEPISQERLTTLRDRMEALGITTLSVVEDASVNPNHLRLSASRPVAVSPICPDWSGWHVANYSNSPTSNFGCAHANNVSKMIENPNDLVAGRGDYHPDAERSAAVIQEYRASSSSEEGDSATGAASTEGGQ